MTAKEAIRHLNTYSSTNGSGQTTQEEHEEAKRMAIKALEGKDNNVPSTDLISRQAVIDALSTSRGIIYPIRAIESLPSAQPEPCNLCKSYGIEDGDTLYISADWDGGIGFDYIRDIHYCPKCGRRLIDG